MPLTSPVTVMGILMAYVYFVLSIGPKFMKNRPPYRLDRLLMAYNIFQVVCNFALAFYVRPLYDFDLYLYRKGFYCTYIVIICVRKNRRNYHPNFLSDRAIKMCGAHFFLYASIAFSLCIHFFLPP